MRFRARASSAADLSYEGICSGCIAIAALRDSVSRFRTGEGVDLVRADIPLGVEGCLGGVAGCVGGVEGCMFGVEGWVLGVEG